MKTLSNQGILAYFTNHRVAANLIMIAVTLAGFVSLNRLNTQMLPDVTIPIISINTSWPEAGAESIDQYLTTPLENSLKSLDDIEDVWSTSGQGSSNIVLRYRLGSNMDDALAEVNNFISTYQDLPENAETPKVKLEKNKDSVFSLLVTTEGPVTELRPLLTQFKNDLLARGIPEVNVRGFPDEEILIETNLLNLVSNKTSIDQLANHIAEYNQDSQGGQLTTDTNTISVTTRSKTEQASAIGAIELNSHRPLSSLSTISRQYKEGARHYVLEGKSVVRILVFRSEQVDSLQTSDIVYEWLNDIKPTLPQGVEVMVWLDLAEIVKGNLDMLIKNGLQGLILVVCILFLFLNRHVAWWSALGIPVSIAGTFMFLYSSGGTINFLSVFAFLMALGIIVDDAIVVGEETVTQMELGKPANEAALIAAKRMFSPIMASSLTTIAAFMPLLFLPGAFGELLRPVPIVIIAVIIASLIECFLILPGHLNHGLGKRNQKRSTFRRKMDDGFNHFKEKQYRPFVTKAIKYRTLTVLIALCMCAIAYALPISGLVTFAPDIEVEDNMVTAYIDFREGTTESAVEEYTTQLRDALTLTEKELGQGKQIVTQVYEIYSANERFTQLQAKLVNRDERSMSNADFLKAWESKIKGGPDVEYISTREESASDSSTLNFFIAGRDLNTLERGANALKQKLKTYPNLSNIQDDLPKGGDEIIFHLTATGKQQGLTERLVSAQLRQALMGTKAQSFVEDDATIDVMVRLPKDSLKNSAQIQDLPIQTPAGQWLRFGDIAEFKTQEGLGTLRHKNGQLGIQVTAEIQEEAVDSNALSKEIYANDVEPILKQFGLTGEIQGGAQDIEEMKNNLKLAAIAGVLLIYVILVWVFSNYSWPLAVMAAIPFGLTGAIFGHWLLGFDLTFLSFFGLFGLSGIIINDSIILISRYQELRNEGMSVQSAIIEASCQRLRAVLLTSITTIGGLVPLLLSDSIQAQLVQSMATSLAFGIGYGTLLVLLVIPCLLTYIESANALSAKFIGKLKTLKSTAN